jgi:hypothetical protein
MFWGPQRPDRECEHSVRIPMVQQLAISTVTDVQQVGNLICICPDSTAFAYYIRFRESNLPTR